MKALVISGGGSKGAFAGGVAEYLINVAKRDYDIFVACSTGSLLIPHLSIGEVGRIKEIFTNVCQDDIFNISPFHIKRLPTGEFKTKINHWNSIRMFLKRKKTFGEHKNLRKVISKIFTEADYDKIRATEKKVVVTVSNLTTNRVVYKHLKDFEYEDFCDWMWASTSFVPFMSLVEKNGYEYADGGFGNYVPIEEAVNLGATEVDVVILKPRQSNHDITTTTNAFDLFFKTMEFSLDQLSYQDILIGHLESIYNNSVKAKFFFTPRLLTKHSFIFEPELMKQWWQEGYDYAKMRETQ